MARCSAPCRPTRCPQHRRGFVTGSANGASIKALHGGLQVLRCAVDGPAGRSIGQTYKIRVPTRTVDGKYLTAGSMAGTQRECAQVADQLITACGPHAEGRSPRGRILRVMVEPSCESRPVVFHHRCVGGIGAARAYAEGAAWGFSDVSEAALCETRRKPSRGSI